MIRDAIEDVRDAEEVVRRLLEGQSSQAIHALCTEALRRWRSGADRRVTRVAMDGDLGKHAVAILAKSAPRSININNAHEAFLVAQGQPFMAPIMDFVWWLFRSGLARPSTYHNSGLAVFHMTETGVRFLDAAGDHPLAPEYLARLQQRHPDIPQAVITLVQDAHACLAAALLRPAAVLLGLAFETAVDDLLRQAVGRALVGEKTVQQAEAGRRIAMLKTLLEKLGPAAEERRLITNAIDFADHLRTRRNDAVHAQARWPFDAFEEMEEWLVSASRHLPVLWRLAGLVSAPSSGG